MREKNTPMIQNVIKNTDAAWWRKKNKSSVFRDTLILRLWSHLERRHSRVLVDPRSSAGPPCTLFSTHVHIEMAVGV